MHLMARISRRWYETVTSLTLWRRAICAAVSGQPGVAHRSWPARTRRRRRPSASSYSQSTGLQGESSFPNPVLQGSATLELTQPMPVFIGPSLGTPLLLPQHVGTLTEMLVESAMPVFVRSSFRTAFLFPKEVGTFADGLFQAGYRF